MRKIYSLGILALGTGSLLVPAQSQTLAGMSAASSIGAGIGAVAAGITAGSVMKGMKNPKMPTEAGTGGRRKGMAPGGAVAVGPGGTSTAPASAALPPLQRGSAAGERILQQLANSGVPAHQMAQGKARRPVALKRRHNAKRSKHPVLAKYKVSPVGWLAHYLPEDRYKVLSKDWQFVSTETDRYYYRPDAGAILLQNPNHIIGFHTWQDAMIAGYKPDPYTMPTPAAELAYMGSFSHGPQLAKFAEYAYAGQVTPRSMAYTYKYVHEVIDAINVHAYAKPLRGATVEKIIDATLTADPSKVPTIVGGSASQPARDLSSMSPEQRALLSKVFNAMGKGMIEAGKRIAGPIPPSPVKVKP